MMQLAEETIHVVAVDLAVESGVLASLAELLSDDEQQRAARFRFEIHRRRYVAARGQLRRILSAYTGVAPEAVAFTYGPKGKPSVAGIEFNLSHSADLGAVALTRATPVGIDVEMMRPTRDLDGLARVSFSPREQQQLRALSGEEKLEAFFRCWTRKEAYVKATGDGLSAALDSFDVDFGDEPAPIRLASAHDVWTTWPLDLGRRGFAGAVAVRGATWTLQRIAQPELMEAAIA